MSSTDLSQKPRVWPAVRMLARADMGRKRHNNEDAVGIEPLAQPWPVAVLADGMGGYNAGEVASAMAVDLVMAAVQSGDNADRSVQAAERVLLGALQLANQAIVSAAQSTPGCSGMGTTVVAALVLDDELLVAHLGDSRAYVWRHGFLLRITRDHSLIQYELDVGLITDEEANTSTHAHLVTRALGVGPHITPEISRLRLEPEDRVLLCSDGLSDMLSDQCLLTIFSEALPLPLLLTALIGAANAAGGRDNIGVVLMEADIQLLPGQSDEAQRLQQADF